MRWFGLVFHQLYLRFFFFFFFFMHAFKLLGDSMHYLVGLVHYSQDLQILYSGKKKTIKNGSYGTIQHLKITFLQCFQFSTK